MIEVIATTRTKPELLELKRGGIQLQHLSLNKQKEKEDIIIPFAKFDYMDVV